METKLNQLRNIASMLLCFILLQNAVNAQSGGQFISDFKLFNNGDKWCWAIAQDQERDMLISVAQGIVVFDGVNQDLIETPFFPTQITFDSLNNIAWVLGYEHCGYLQKNSQGIYNYNQCAFKEEQSFKQIFLQNDTVTLVLESSILRYSRNNFEFIDELVSKEFPIENAFLYKDDLLIVLDYFVYHIENGELQELNYDFPVDEISYAITLSDGQVLLGTPFNTMYIFNASGFKTKTIKGGVFFDNNVVVDGELINDSLMVLSSLAGGMAIVNYKENKVYKLISYFNGLPDEEIRAFFIDDLGALWISHQLGISRVDFNINIANYQHYPGLKGTPLALSSYNKQLYVGTSEGVFQLTDIKSFNEFTVSVNVPVDVEVEVPVVMESKPKTIDDANTNGKRKKSMLGFLSRKKNKSDPTPESAALEKEPEVITTQKVIKTQTRTRKIKKRSIKSISHQYVVIKGINDKCRALLEYENTLFVAGNNGLYYVSGDKTRKLIPNVYVVDMYRCDSQEAIYCCTNNGLYKVSYTNGKWKAFHFSESTDSYINSIVYEGENTWVLAFENMVVRAKLEARKIKVEYSTNLPESSSMHHFLKRFNDSTFVYGGNNSYYYNASGEFEAAETFDERYNLINDQQDYVWERREKGWACINGNGISVDQEVIDKLVLYKSIRHLKVENDKTLWLIDEENKIVKLKPNVQINNTPFEIKVLNLVLNQDTVYNIAKVNLPANETDIYCKLGAPYYLKQEGIKFTYKLEGLDDEWSPLTTNSEFQIRYIPYGNFTLKMKAINDLGISSSTIEIPIKVAKPFTQSFIFMIVVMLSTLFIAFLLFKYRMQSLEKSKILLEKKVQERTQTIQEQKGQIEEQHSEITESIRYAQRIQSAMLPDHEIVEAMLPDHFILFMPRDIVSGDFYFFKPIGDKIVFVVADCTGHGVPGGFMSMLGISFLSEITSQLGDKSAAEVINLLRDKIKMALGQVDFDSNQKDGMDLGITIIDTAKNEIQFAGAFNPLYIIRDNKIETVKADRQPVAVYIEERDFTNHIVPVQKGDIFYMFSDGFPDQIGGPKEKKYMTKNFKQLLLNIHKKPMKTQRELLEREIMDWKGDVMQMDDILVTGFKLI